MENENNNKAPDREELSEIERSSGPVVDPSATKGSIPITKTLRAHWTFLITILGGLYLVLYGFNLSELSEKQDRLDNLAKESATTVRMAKVEYPTFYVAFLEQQLWSILEEFSINNDAISIARIDATITAIQPFFRLSHASKLESDTLEEKTRAYASTFELFQRITAQQKALKRREAPDRLPTDNDEAIEDSLLSIIRMADEKLIPFIPQAGSWLKANAYILMARHLKDSVNHYGWLRNAQEVLEEELLRSMPADTALNRWPSELRTSLAIALSDISSTRERETQLLDSAIHLLNRNIALGQDWDPSIYNNLADYFGRKALLSLDATIHSVGFDTMPKPGSCKDYVRRAEATARRAVARSLGEPVYRVTLFEILCLKVAVMGHVEEKFSQREDFSELRSAMRDIFALAYNDFYTSYLFGTPEGSPPTSDMMRHLKRANPTLFANLLEEEKSLKRSFPDGRH